MTFQKAKKKYAKPIDSNLTHASSHGEFYHQEHKERILSILLVVHNPCSQDTQKGNYRVLPFEALQLYCMETCNFHQ